MNNLHPKNSFKTFVVSGIGVVLVLAFLFQQNYCNKLAFANRSLKKTKENLVKENSRLNAEFASFASFEVLGKIAQEKHGLVFDTKEPQKIVVSADCFFKDEKRTLRKEINKDEETFDFQISAETAQASNE